MSSRNMEKEVADGADAGFGGRLGGLRADAFEGAQPLLEDAGARPVDGGVRAGRRGSARAAPAKDAHYWAASSHHQLGWPPSWVSTSTPSGTWVSISASAIGAPSPAITVTISAPSARCWIVVGQGRAGAAPGDDLAVGEADRVALAEAALGVVAGGRGDAAGGDRRRAPPSRRSAFSAERGAGIELDQRQQARLLGGAPARPGPASRRARRRARRPSPRSRSWAGPGPPRPARSWIPASSS